MKKSVIFAFVIAALSLSTARAADADVRVTMHDGLVTIVAKDATIRQILAEWARVGQATIVNADRIAGGPVTIEFSEVPEKQALDILLRTVSGFFAAPRPIPLPNAAQFDRIVVLPTTAQPRSASTISPAPPPLAQTTRFQLPPVSDDDLGPNGPNPIDASRIPPVNQFNPPFSTSGDGARPATQQPPAVPTGPVGTAAPGMVLPAPPQQGQPAPPQQGQPVSGPGRF